MRTINQPTAGSKLAGAAVLSVVLSACGGGATNTSSSVQQQPNSSSSVPASSVAVSSSVASSSSAPTQPQVVSLMEKCETGFAPHETDGSLPDTYHIFEGTTPFGGQQAIDTTVRMEIIEWMNEHKWQEGHELWHASRRCRGGGFGFGGPQTIGGVNSCDFSDPEISQPQQDECAGPRDGYEFLVMHRHMINTLKSLWPSLNDQFNGWETFPRQEDYPPELIQNGYWSDQQYTSQVYRAGDLVDSIPNMSRQEVLNKWPTEGAFAQWIQCGGQGDPNLHGALHFQANSPLREHNVGNPARNLDSYLFWKLHGWIDKAWEKYREKVGIPDNDPAYQEELVKQCKEHHYWAQKVDPSLEQIDNDGGSNSSSGSGSGDFNAFVRGSFATCAAGCHATEGFTGLSLSSDLSAQDFISNLVNVDSNASGYKLVVPYQPENSWLYLKITGQSQNMNVTCLNNTSCRDIMTGMSNQQIETVRQWIADGANP